MNEGLSKSILMGLGTGFLLVFCLAPVCYMVVISFSSNPFLTSSGQAWRFTLMHYRDVLFSPSIHFLEYLANSLLVSGMSSLLTILIASLAAYAIARLELPGKFVILLTVLAVSMFPQISLISYLFKVMTRLGWVNTYGALVFPYVAWTLPLSLWVLVSYFLQVPRDLDSAALVDGCSRWQILWKVVVPVAAPGIFSATLLAFIFTFNELLFALMLTTDYRARTVPVGIALFQGLHGETPWGSIMAASTVSTLPLVFLILIFQRYIIQGLTQGAVKG